MRWFLLKIGKLDENLFPWYLVSDLKDIIRP